MLDAHDLAFKHFETARSLSIEFGYANLTDCIAYHIADLDQNYSGWKSLVEQGQKLMQSDVLGLLLGEVSNSDTDVDDGLPPVSIAKDLDQILLQACHKKATAFLTFDPDCREAWEIQRTGNWSTEDLVGDVFARSLVAQRLGDDVDAERLGAILAQFEHNGWRFFRDFKALPPDIDDIAQAIHLSYQMPWNKAQQERYLETPLRWLAKNRDQNGHFPVWLTEGIDDKPEDGWVPLGGFSCLACEANLMTALATLNGPFVQAWITGNVDYMLSTWEKKGAKSAYYYQWAYTHYLFTTYLLSLGKQSNLQSSSQDRISKIISEIKIQQLDMSVSENPLTTACSASVLMMLDADISKVNPLIQMLIETQSYDGGWDASDFYLCSGTQFKNPAWHKSRILTTSIVYHALNHYIHSV